MLAHLNGLEINTTLSKNSHIHLFAFGTDLKIFCDRVVKHAKQHHQNILHIFLRQMHIKFVKFGVVDI